jgi:hypothetical protein
MSKKSLTKKIKLAKIAKIKSAPRWVDIKKFGMKRARSRRVDVNKVKKWRRIRLRV